MGSMCARTICDAAVRDAENILFIYVFGCIRWNLLYVFIERVRARVLRAAANLWSRKCARLRRAKVIGNKWFWVLLPHAFQNSLHDWMRLVSVACCDRLSACTRITGPCCSLTWILCRRRCHWQQYHLYWPDRLFSVHLCRMVSYLFPYRHLSANKNEQNLRLNASPVVTHRSLTLTLSLSSNLSACKRGSKPARGLSLFVGEPPNTYSTIFTPRPPVESRGLQAKSKKTNHRSDTKATQNSEKYLQRQSTRILDKTIYNLLTEELQQRTQQNKR